MIKLFGLFTGLLLLLPSANAIEVGVGVKAGTLGVGPEITVALTKTINARVSVTSLDVDSESETVEVGDTGATGNIDARLGFDFGAKSLLFDWHVFDGTFHLTAGLMKNDTKLSFKGALQDTITIDGEVLTSDDINGDITGDISLGDSFQPYVGVGWGRKAGDGGGLSLSVELGVAMLDPTTDLDAELGAASGLTNEELRTRLDSIEDDAEKDLDLVDAWPVLSIGINYAF